MKTGKINKEFTLVSILSFVSLFVFLKFYFLGDLISKFHLNRDEAMFAVGILGSVGAYAFSIAFPFLAPYILTLRGLIAVFGTGFAVGW